MPVPLGVQLASVFAPPILSGIGQLFTNNSLSKRRRKQSAFGQGLIDSQLDEKTLARLIDMFMNRSQTRAGQFARRGTAKRLGLDSGLVEGAALASRTRAGQDLFQNLSPAFIQSLMRKRQFGREVVAGSF